MKIVIPDDYQDMVDQLACFSLIRHHDVIRYREPARDLAALVERLHDADVVVSIRERVEFSRALLEQLPKLKLIALVGRNSQAIDFAACTALGIPVTTGKSNSPDAPAELALALIVASRRNVALEAERMKRGEWPCTLSHRLRGSTLGIFGLGAIGQLVAEGGRGLGMDILVWGQENSLKQAAAKGYASAANVIRKIYKPESGRRTMKDEGLGRRDFLKGAVVGGAAAATVSLPPNAEAQQGASPAAAPDAASPGYSFLNLEEAAFVEALVDHMVPADDLTPKGTDIGINIFIDRALAGGWGKGERLYMQGPWKLGLPSQGYQLPLTPAQLYRAGIEATNAHCRKSYGKPFDRLDDKQREDVLVALSSGKLSFDNGLPARVFWTTLYQTVMEGMFSDPIYGGNRNKAGWRLIGFPGAIAVHRENVEKYRDKKFPADPISISDMS